MSVEVVVLGREHRSGSKSRLGASWRTLGRSGHAIVLCGGIAVVVATLLWLPSAAVAPATGAALGVLLAAAVVDVAERRLPNRLVLAAAAPVLVAAVLGSAAGALAGGALVGLPLLLTHLVSPSGLGFGDVKAGAVLGGALGLLTPALAPAGLLLGLLASAGWAVGGRRRSVPLGPGLVGGGIAAALLGPLVGVAPW